MLGWMPFHIYRKKTLEVKLLSQRVHKLGIFKTEVKIALQKIHENIPSFNGVWGKKETLFYTCFS